ncbi:MAG: Ig-like domain-containing protein, partial [Acidobacteriia bacterium]|nr:Ig-like domain-containing protein [Terriglobia bacterium]
YPGARLPQALLIQVRDEFGNVLAGVPVRFTASPGAQTEGASTVTDALGQAEAYLRLPLRELPALATAEAGRQVVTFSARAVSGTLPGFPRFMQGTSPETRDALTNAAAATLRYLQDTGQVPASNGAVEPTLLHRFLKDFCVFDPRGEKICDGFLMAPGGSAPVMNLWRLPAFAGGNLDIAPAGLPTGIKAEQIRDLLGQGIPVLLGLTLSSGGSVLGSHFVVANGVSPNGAILLHDPSPVFNRTTLDEYLAGFTASGGQYRGALQVAVQLAPRSPSPVGLLVVSGEALTEVSSAAGSCGFALSWLETQAEPGSTALTPGAGRNIRMHYCDGILPAYQLDLGGTGRQSFILTDLSSSGGRSETAASVPAAFRFTRPGPSWTAGLQQLSFEAASVRNGADFSTRLSAGVLASIFGQGLSVPGQPAVVEVGGRPAMVISESSFQVNIAAPRELAPGEHLVRISSGYGQAEQLVAFQAVSPALFRQASQRGVVLNQDGTLNSPSNPARRGQVIVVYATGLGAVASQGELEVVQTPVAGFLDGNPLETLFAGFAPGFPGVYQLNLRIGAELPPGLQQSLTVRQGGIDAEAVFIAVQ